MEPPDEQSSCGAPAERVFVDRDPRVATVHADRILVVGGSDRTLECLRLAVIRSDDVVFVAGSSDAETLRFVDRFAIEHRRRTVEETDFDGVTAVLIANGDIGVANRIVRQARRRGIPLYVDARPLVSDFTRLELLERSPSTVAGAALVRPPGA